MLLILAEKEDQAKAYAEALKGNVSRKNKNIISVRGSTVLKQQKIEIGYLQGHLYEPKEPEEYDEKFKDWSLANLPIFPRRMEFKLKAGFSKRRDDIADSANECDELWLATDSDIEGESIGYIFLQKIGASKKITGRVWIESLTLDGLAKSFKNVRSPRETIGKAHAGFCRIAGDWLIGMNYSRLATVLLREKGFQDMKYFPVGRVQTPLVKLIAERRRERENFKPVTSYRLNFKDENGVVFTSDKDRPFKTKEDAEKAIKILSGKYQPRIVNFEKKEKSQSAPGLYKLGNLQGLMNKTYGVPTDQVEKDIAENLYKDYHLTSYPRTDSKLLKEDDFNTIKSRLDKYVSFYKSVSGVDIGYLLNNLSPRQKYIDKTGKKIQEAGGHHGLSPNIPINKDNEIYLKNEGSKPTLPFDEIKGNYKLAYWHILSRTLAIFADDYKYMNTSIETNAGGLKFTSSINERVSEHSFKDIIENDVSLDEESNLVITPMEKSKSNEDFSNLNYQENQILQGEFTVKEENTTPPKPITESNIVESIMPAYSLGTQATRGNIISKIRQIGLIKVNNKANKKKNLVKHEFIPTDKSLVLLDLLSQAKILNFAQVKNWEDSMTKMSANQSNSDGFIDDIKENTMNDINTLKNSINDIKFHINPEDHKIELAKNKKEVELAFSCPKCDKGNISSLSYDKHDRHYSFYIHDKCKFFMPMTISSVAINPEEIEKIFNGTYPYKDFINSKDGSDFKAKIKYNGKGFYFVYPKHFEKKYELECPKCKKNPIGLEIYTNKKQQTKRRYSCQNEDCSFKCYTTIAGLEITINILRDVILNKRKEYEFTAQSGNKFPGVLFYSNGEIKLGLVKHLVKEYGKSCPLCSKGMLILTTHKYQEKDIYNFSCTECNLDIPEVFVGKKFTPEEVISLVTNKSGEYTFHSAKKHKDFKSILEFHPKAKQKLKFKSNKSNKGVKKRGIRRNRVKSSRRPKMHM